MRTNRTTYVARKQCEDCPYIMRNVPKRRRLCKQCINARLAARMKRPDVRAATQAGRRALEDRLFINAIDAELARPTCYWENPC
jgi:hypothetical protein